MEANYGQIQHRIVGGNLLLVGTHRLHIVNSSVVKSDIKTYPGVVRW